VGFQNYFVSLGRLTTTSIAALFLAIMLAGRMPRLVFIGQRGCALRIVGEINETGKTRHAYFPEIMEQQWQGNLERLKRFCESA
jgi:hypothetical protein